MSIVKVYNKKAGVTYVYESESYWDKEKKQPRNRRKLIGKINPTTGEIVPTGKRGRPASVADATEVVLNTDATADTEYRALLAVIDEKNRENALLRDRVHELESNCRRNEETMRRLRAILDESVNP